jgi:glycosyltransferase XagB
MRQSRVSPESFDLASVGAGRRCALRRGPTVALSGVGAATRRARTDERPRRQTLRAFVARGPDRSLSPPPTQFRVCPEIDCIRNLLPRRLIAAAERRARAIGLGADAVLISGDAVTEEAYLRALSASFGTSFEPLDDVARADCPLDDDQLIQAGATGLLPLCDGGEITWVIAPRYLAARNLAKSRQSYSPFPRSFRLTSSERLMGFVTMHARNAIGRRAVDGLHRLSPVMSNAPRRRGFGGFGLAAAAFLLAAAGVLTALPAETIGILSAVLCTVFLAAAALRLVTAAFIAEPPARLARMRDDELPVYTIMCPLYREANVVAGLVAAIRRLDYPPEKLDVKFVVEIDDYETRRALALLDLGPPFTVITAPPFGPRTKPKALNVALMFARGSFTVVYDAEDMPEPDQLRRALSVFMAADERLACVQAALTIDNTTDSWLTRMFTASYAGQFDAFLPGLAALQLPFPLGGSSNHFRTNVLRHVGGWDPYNVTEDADLGIRLARLGYRLAAVSSATYEEAPGRFTPWLRQRTRWYKGWIQTWLVHMRRPGKLVRDLTPMGAIAFQLFLGCNVLAALIHPVFTIGLCYALMTAPLHSIAVMDASVFAAALLLGYISTIVLDMIGLRRRRLLGHSWALLLTPLYWFLLSIAAWRALLQLLYDPQRWDKTEHGLARTSRLFGAGNLQRSTAS